MQIVAFLITWHKDGVKDLLCLIRYNFYAKNNKININICLRTSQIYKVNLIHHLSYSLSSANIDFTQTFALFLFWGSVFVLKSQLTPLSLTWHYHWPPLDDIESQLFNCSMRLDLFDKLLYRFVHHPTDAWG